MNFLFESKFMKKHKLKQVVDVVFGVHDDRAVELGQLIKELGSRLTQARSELAAARAFVEEQDLPVGDALTAQTYENELLELNDQLQALDGAAQAGTAFAGRLRREHQKAAQHARRAAGVVRDCETQLARMMPLRAQYADDLVVARLREELGRLGDASQDRDRIIDRISSRYSELLRQWRYPKLSQPMIDTNLVPYVRGDSYREASSGARTLLTLAWQLAVFEVAVETSAAHPGFLMIDNPQKNLAHGATRDAAIADASAINDFYHHLATWLAEQGAGAQVIIVDNSPPSLAEGSVVVRYSRNEDRPPAA
ncbi:hypothetical protein [Streptomyces sp. NPDC056491]|uniref:hypothetical protein n=1 Tax=Streptomyces sp. NPDC056491 TaxID=3345837 RepID=UPI003682A5D1